MKASVIADFSEEDYRLAVFDLLDQAALSPSVLADLVENSGTYHTCWGLNELIIRRHRCMDWCHRCTQERIARPVRSLL